MSAAWKLYDVDVVGYGSEVMTGKSAASVRAATWRSDVFSHISFGKFMGMCRVRVRRDPPTDDGYGYIRRAYGVSPAIGQRVRLRDEGAASNDREGAVLYPGTSSASVHVLLDGAERVSLVHPDNVELLAQDPAR